VLRVRKRRRRSKKRRKKCEVMEEDKREDVELGAVKKAVLVTGRGGP
jgi:hypothetical protein